MDENEKNDEYFLGDKLAEVGYELLEHSQTLDPASEEHQMVIQQVVSITEAYVDVAKSEADLNDRMAQREQELEIERLKMIMQMIASIATATASLVGTGMTIGAMWKMTKGNWIMEYDKNIWLQSASGKKSDSYITKLLRPGKF